MTSLVTIDGVTKPYPDEVPNKDFREAWVWSGDAIAIDWAKYLTHFRGTATLPKPDFVNGAADLGLVSDADAIEAARGGWPPAFDPATATLTNAQKREAKVLWAGVGDVARSAPLLAMIVAAGLATDQQLDTLFRYDGQYPV